LEIAGHSSAVSSGRPLADQAKGAGTYRGRQNVLEFFARQAQATALDG
jgi:hypothetical protein